MKELYLFTVWSAKAKLLRSNGYAVARSVRSTLPCKSFAFALHIKTASKHEELIKKVVCGMALFASLWLMYPPAQAMASIGPFGGTVDSIAVDPSDPDTVYAGAQGIFKTTDGGEHWLEIGLDHQAVIALAVDPDDADTVYVGTSQAGVFKSSNGGENWSAAGLSNRKVCALAVSPVDSDTVYAGTGIDRGGLFRSTNGGRNWSVVLPALNIQALAIDPQAAKTIYAGTQGSFADGFIRPSGIYKSTDGGDQWSSIGPPNTAIWSIVIDPQNSNTIYAAVGYAFGEVDKSTDGGATWSLANAGLLDPDVRSLAIDPEQTETIYAGSERAGVYRTTNGGQIWSATPLSGTALILAAHPYQPDLIYAGLSVRGAFKSLNSGDDWIEINEGINRREVTSIVVDPYDSKTLYAVANGEVVKTTNGGKDWQPVDSGLDRTTRMLVINPKDSNVLYAGGESVFKSSDGGDHWSMASQGLPAMSGSIYAMTIDPVGPETLFVGTLYRGMFKTTNGGDRWAAVDASSNGQVDVLAVNPKDSNTVYAGLLNAVIGSAVRKTTSGGDSWFSVSRGLPGRRVTSLVIDPWDPDTVYTSTCCPGEGGIFKSTNGGDQWSVIDQGLTGRDVYALAIDGKDTQTIYAGTTTAIFKTMDAGENWAVVSVGISPRIVQSLVIDPQDSNIIYAGTLESIFASYDGGQTWQ